MDFQDLLDNLGLKWDFGGENGGRDGAILNPNKLVLILLGFFTSVLILLTVDQEIHLRVRTDRLTRVTDTQTQNGFVICPGLYAIAMVQIINAK